MYPIRASSRLDQLELPYLPMIIEEAFSVLYWQSGHMSVPSELTTVADLAMKIGKSASEVCTRLQDIRRHCQNCELDAKGLTELLEREPKTFLLSISCQENGLSRTVYHHDIPHITALNIPELFELWQERDQTVVIIAEAADRGLSGCLYLKDKGHQKVYYHVAMASQ